MEPSQSLLVVLHPGISRLVAPGAIVLAAIVIEVVAKSINFWVVTTGISIKALNALGLWLFSFGRNLIYI